VANAEVRAAGVFRREIAYTPTPSDLATLVEGLILAWRIFFAGGAVMTMPHTWDYYEFTKAATRNACGRLFANRTM
jgi:hypothetical protein